MGYKEQRDAILIHAAAAAVAVNAQFKDVAIGAPVPRGNRCVRVFWGGESEPVRIDNRVLNGELVSPVVGLVAFWNITSMGDLTALKALDTEMSGFVHNLRTAVLADSQLGGASTDLRMDYAAPDFVVIGGARWATVEVEFTLDYLEYPLGA